MRITFEYNDQLSLEREKSPPPPPPQLNSSAQGRNSLTPVCSGYHPDRFIFQGLKFMELGFRSAGPDWACIGDNWAEIGKVDEQFVDNRKSRVPAN
ncbi:hypothetical protein AVEN_185251-1 [Araneus ventricosus]|uniref:Uncharacterized protein n=1 Tax=Araneus ventricosus TaxID=182803 RepID=A0A4Y2S9T1_ARAVE|nr:hypothetical protein AVEN_185251-1 [Araneus ventricosus]